MSLPVSFFVDGTPATKGSWRPVHTRSGKIRMLPQIGREKSWAEAVARQARAGMGSVNAHATSDPVVVKIGAWFERPKKSKYEFPPLGDADKLARSILDALTGIVYADDKAVVRLEIQKAWGERAGARISIYQARMVEGTWEPIGEPQW